MKQVLVLGATGIVGNAVYKYLTNNKTIACFGTCHSHKLSKKLIRYDATDIASFDALLLTVKPEWIINCIVSKKINNFPLSEFVYTNALFPQLLSILCKVKGANLIHISTNGVFKGNVGSYRDADMPDAEDLYGKSKIYSENIDGLILRTSLIGHSEKKEGLLDWMLTVKSGSIEGYTNVFWNGITTLTISKVIERIIEQDMHINGVLHLGTSDISKYDLLKHIKKIYGSKVLIKPAKTVSSTLTLKPSVLQKVKFHDLITPIDIQLQELKKFYSM